MIEAWTNFADAVLRDHLEAWPSAVTDDLEPLLSGIPPFAQARQELDAYLAQNVPLRELIDRLGLDDDAEAVFVFLLGVEVSSRTALLCGLAQGSQDAALPSLELLAKLAGQRALGTFTSTGVLARAELVRYEWAGQWATTRVGLDVAVPWALAGHPVADPDVPVGTRRFPGAPVQGRQDVFEVVTGGTADARIAWVRKTYPGAAVLAAPIPESGHSWAALVREATLTGAVVLIDVGAEGSLVEPADTVLSIPHLLWVFGAQHRVPLADPLAGMCRVVDLARVRPTVTPQGGLGAARVERAAFPGSAATRVVPRVTLADVVLTKDQRDGLTTLCRNRRLSEELFEHWGFSPQGSMVLLHGAPGTGKTVVAEAIAGSLGQELLTANIATLVSKYIGETQKNFDRLFAEIEHDPAVLLIDEVDALFGKRTGIASSNDRYANLETAYLLQRTERLDGVVIMTTNLGGNIDPAFVRRFDMSISFDLPKEPERLSLWQTLVPPEAAGRDVVDMKALAADYEVTGAMIANAARAAAYEAAAANRGLSTDLLRSATEEQLRKHGWLSGGPR